MSNPEKMDAVYDARALGTPRVLVLGLQHLFAMFGATVLVPAITGLNVSTTLLCAGLGTLLFHVITGMKIPAFLGSSFAFLSAYGLVTSTGQEIPLAYSCFGVAVAGMMYLVLAWFFKIFGTGKVMCFFPPIVSGPVIIAIGLTLSGTAIQSCSANWLVALAAIAVVEGLVEDDVIRHVAKTFGGVAHRIELVRIKDGVRYYNDSIASSPSRTIAGLRSFPEKVILIAGGYDKQIPYDVLGPEICAHVKKLYLGGATGPKIRKAVEECSAYRPGAPEIVDCGDFASAVTAAAAGAQAGDVVLMSPASAAFDQFKNFMVRGEFFKKMIMEL